MNRKCKIELYNDHFENAKRYGIPHAQLIIADMRKRGVLSERK